MTQIASFSVWFSDWEGARSHTGPIQESRELVKQVVCCCWPGNLGLYGWNEWANFADTLHMYKSSVKMEYTDSVLIPTLWAISWIITQYFCMTIHWTFSNIFSFQLALHWGVAEFEVVVALLDLSFAHGIIAKGILYWMHWAWCDISAWSIWSSCVKWKSNKFVLHICIPGITAGNWPAY